MALQETIYVLNKVNPHVRSIDISEHMGYSKPSVSRAVGILKQGGYIEVDDDGFITLTPSGQSVAQKIFERHTFIAGLLIRLGVDPKTAAEDACRIEHAISDTSFEAIKTYVKNTK